MDYIIDEISGILGTRRMCITPQIFFLHLQSNERGTGPYPMCLCIKTGIPVEHKPKKQYRKHRSLIYNVKMYNGKN